MRPPGAVRPVGAKFDPLDEARQLVAKLLDRRVVGFPERLHGLCVALLAFWPARPADIDPDRCLSRLDLWVVAVLQHLYPLDCVRGEGRPQLLLDAGSPCLLHVTLAKLLVTPSLRV